MEEDISGSCLVKMPHQVKMSFVIVNWFPEERTMDITHETPHHKPRWYVTYASYIVPAVFSILNHLLK